MGSEATITLRDPRTGKPRGQTPAHRQPEVARTVRVARRASTRWAALTGRARADRLTALARLVQQDAASYVAAEQAGTGKPATEAAAEVEQAIDLLQFFAWAARTGLSPAAGELVAGYESWVRWEPLGVVGVVVPWNYPLMMAIWRCAPALAAGNTAVVKPAESTPDSALLLAEHAADTLGEAVLATLTGDRETGRLLVRDQVDAVAFTGSPHAGADVAAGAGTKRISLELGGNSPVLVFPDAPEHTWADLAAACTYNAGQSCAAPARVIAFPDNYDEVVTALAAAMAARGAGRDFGPLNNPDQLARYDGLLTASAAELVKQAPLAVSPDERAGFWRPATVLADLPENDPAVREEVFGPVLTVQRADDLDHALRLANAVPQALAASVWSRDLPTALAVAGRLNAGEVWLNCHLVQTAELPHGGRGASGTGTDLSVLALHEYQRPKTVTARITSEANR